MVKVLPLPVAPLQSPQGCVTSNGGVVHGRALGAAAYVSDRRRYWSHDIWCAYSPPDVMDQFLRLASGVHTAR